MCSHWGQALGLCKEVPLPTILCFIFQSDVQRWEISPVTCRNATPLWQIGFPWTTSLNQHFPSLLCPFQIFCYNNETVVKIETYCHSVVRADMSSIKCALTSHTENRTTKCDGWSKLLTLLGLKFSYWLSALSGRKEGWSSSFRLSLSWSCLLPSLPRRHGLWPQLWTKRNPSSSVRCLVTAVNQPN